MISAIFKKVGTANKFCVEIGLEKVEGGVESNTRVLKEWGGWNGVMIDETYNDPDLEMHTEKVQESTISKRLKELKVPSEPDLMSIGIYG